MTFKIQSIYISGTTIINNNGIEKRIKNKLTQEQHNIKNKRNDKRVI